MAQEFEAIRTDLKHNVLTITLNRPDRLNAFNNVMRDELFQAFDAADADDEVRAIVMTGAGRGFCAGADLHQGAATFDYASRGDADDARRDGGGLVSLRIFDLKKPIISA